MSDATTIERPRLLLGDCYFDPTPRARRQLARCRRCRVRRQLPVVTFTACGHRARWRLACHCPCCAWPLQAQQFAHHCTPVATRAGDLTIVALVVCVHCKRGSLPVIVLAARGHRKRGNLPVLAHANYSPNVTLAMCAVDLFVVALAAHSCDALLSPAAGHTLAIIASNVCSGGRGVDGSSIEGVARCGWRCRNSSKLRSKLLAAAAFSHLIPQAGSSSTPMEDGSLRESSMMGRGRGGRRQEATASPSIQKGLTIRHSDEFV